MEETLADFSNLEIIVGTVAVSIAILVFAITWRYNSRNEEFRALMQVVPLLSDRKHRLARETMYNRYRDYCNDKADYFDANYIDDSTKMSLKEATGIVRSDLEQVGVLIYKTLTLNDLEIENCDKTWKIFRKGFLSKNLFFNMFSGVVVSSWYALENKIRYDRDTIRGQTFMLYFEKLKIDAEKYRKDNKLGDSEMEQLHKKQLEKQKKSENS